MNIGITLLFKENVSSVVSGVLKSLVFQSETHDFKNKVDELGNKIASHYNYTFLGVNDVFTVSGEAKQGEILGRTSYYDFTTLKKANALKNDSFNNLTDDNQFKKLKCSLIYFCQDSKLEKFTITVQTILESQFEQIMTNAIKMGNNNIFKKKIIDISLDKLNKLDFIGIESMEEIDLKFNVFETLYSDFENLEQLTDEIISQTELNEELKDIFGNVPN